MEDKGYAFTCTNQSMGFEWWNEMNEESEEYYYYMPLLYMNPCTLDSFNGSTREEFPDGTAIEVSVILICVLFGCPW